MSTGGVVEVRLADGRLVVVQGVDLLEVGRVARLCGAAERETVVGLVPVEPVGAAPRRRRRGRAAA